MDIRNKILAAAMSCLIVLGLTACVKKPAEATVTATETKTEKDAVTEKDCMLIYFGKEYVGDKDYPVFEYFYPSKEFENTDFAHIVMVYKGEYKDNFKYGDIVTVSKPIDLKSYDLKFRENEDVNKYNPFAEYHEIDPSTQFTYKGSVFKDMEKKTLTVTNERYWSDYEESFTTLTLKDKDNRIYSFSYLWRNPEEGRPDILNNNIGDSIEFAVYKNNAIMKLSEGTGLPEGKVIKPDVNKPFDKEAFFIYVGSEGGFPVFEHYTVKKNGADESLESRSVFYKGVLPQSPKYGDVFVTSGGEVKITQGRNIGDNSHEREFRISDELSSDTKLEYIGNGFDIMPKKKLIRGENNYIGFYLFSCTLVEPDFTARYAYEYYGNINEVNLDDYEQGKTVEFICYKNRLIIPAKQ